MTTATPVSNRAVEVHGDEPAHHDTPVPETRDRRSFIPNLVFALALLVAVVIEIAVLSLLQINADPFVYDDQAWMVILIFHVLFMAWPVIRAVMTKELILARSLIALGSTLFIVLIYPFYMRMAGNVSQGLWESEAFAFAVGVAAVLLHALSAIGLTWRFDGLQLDAVRQAKAATPELETRVRDYERHVAEQARVVEQAQADYNTAEAAHDQAQSEQKTREEELEAANKALEATSDYQRLQAIDAELVEMEQRASQASSTISEYENLLKSKSLSSAQRASHEADRDEANAELQRLVGLKRELNAEKAALRHTIDASDEQAAVKRAERIVSDAYAARQRLFEALKAPKDHLEQVTRAHGELSTRHQTAQEALTANETRLTEGKQALAGAVRSTLFAALTPLVLSFLLCYPAWYGNTLV